ncbi:MAG: universal stress protein [Kiloniellales bacterium]|jgi:nucleotide-binding universal stress UspA family protein
MFNDILLPIDLGDLETSAKAVSVTVEQCKSDGARLHVLAVVPGFGMSIISQYFPADFEEKSLADASGQVQAFIDANIPSDIASQAVVASGTVYEEILRVAKKIPCDLIVMGSHRAELKDYLLGPNSSRVVRHAACSVMVVRD